MTLPYDYSRCFVTPENRDCPLAVTCLRRLGVGGKFQDLTAYKGGRDCDGYIGKGKK